jgi:hypothetical protein
MKTASIIKGIMQELGITTGYIVAECGAGPFLECGPLIEDASNVILVDPIPGFLKHHRETHGDKVETHLLAIDYEVGEKTFVVPKKARRGHLGGGAGQGFLAHTPDSPARRKRPRVVKGWHRRKTNTAPFSTVDPGSIDIAIIDIEGHELCVLETMTSRPAILCVEAFADLNTIGPIDAWAESNGYRKHSKHRMNHFYVRD